MTARQPGGAARAVSPPSRSMPMTLPETISADYTLRPSELAEVLALRADGDDAGEVSLAENVIRVPMHPADQVVAFTKLADAGQSVSAIAARFGASERIVEQRLRLGNAAPELLDAYRARDCCPRPSPSRRASTRSRGPSRPARCSAARTSPWRGASSPSAMTARCRSSRGW